MYKSAIIGVLGLSLSEGERNLFSLYKPVGFILFSRNIKDKEQIKNLVSELRACINNTKAPILIDQEGGRVARLRGKDWYTAPPASIFGRIAEIDIEDAKRAAYLNALLIGNDLSELGIDVNCAPVVDIPVAGSHDVIGDRAFSENKKIVTMLAQAAIDGFRAAGVKAIVKHIPGHGRANADSHWSLPVVETNYEELVENDFYPFQNLQNANWAMTAHILYKSIDADNPATQSPEVIRHIRETIGFKGIILSDCISMKALTGSIPEIAAKTVAAGVDIVLYSKQEGLEDMLASLPLLNRTQVEMVDNSYSPYMESTDIPSVQIELSIILEKYKSHCIYVDSQKCDPTENILD